MNSFRKIIATFDNDLAINRALSINCNLCDMVFVMSYPFLSILVTSLSIRTENVIYFSVLSPTQVNCFSSSSASSFLIK